MEQSSLAHTFVSTADGYYQTQTLPIVTLIVVNELPITPQNYPLLIFATNKRKFQQSLTHILSQEQFDYVFYAYHVRPQATKELLIMAGITSLPRENLEFIAQDIGEEILTLLSPEARVRQFPKINYIEKFPGKPR